MPPPSKPTAEPMEKGTRQVRVYEDVGDMISWIVRVTGENTASLLDPLVRAEITEKYMRYEEQIKKIKAAEDALKKVETEAKQAAQKKGKK